MFLQLVEAIVGVGLLAYGLLEMRSNPVWWAYAPIYMLAAALAVVQLPRNSTWRTLSSLSIVVGGVYTSFLLWTFTSIESSPTISLKETKNIPPLGLGIFLISFVRLTKDKITQPVHYIRSSIILFFAIVSFYGFITYFPFSA
uniref:Transmembrane protein n=1 Tax=Caenorhabditis tropicalis TaxID=1561998 RepID=A0A1I7TKM2_9PELO